MNQAIKELEERTERLNEEFVRVRTELTEAQDALHALKIAECGVSVGQLVKNAKGTEFRVAKISAMYERVHIYVNEKRKDGKWGTRQRHRGILGYNIFPVEQSQAAKA